MRHRMVSSIVDSVANYRRNKAFGAILSIVLVVLGPMLVVATFVALQPIEGARGALRLVLTLDLIYVLFVATLVVGRLVQMASARRAKSAGSRLHFRLTTAFAFLALFPTVLVAVFAVLTVNQSLEGWFSDRVRNAVGASLSAAEAYQRQQRVGLAEDVALFANSLDDGRRRGAISTSGDLRQALEQLEPLVERGLKEIYVINNLGALRVRGPRSYLFDFERPSVEQMSEVDSQGILIIEDFANQELRVLIRLQRFSNHYLYLTRAVDGDLLELLGDTTETANYYNQLESDRDRLLFDFGLLYLVFALILILTATWLGLWFAERLADPVGRLAAAAQKVGAGDLDARVENITGDDEISMLARYFNQMTHQLKGQRDTLIAGADQAERRRRLFDSVLASVTSGVIGLDKDGCVTFVNRSAQRVLDLSEETAHVHLGTLVPEFVNLIDEIQLGVRDIAQKEVKLIRNGKQENLLVRIAQRQNTTGAAEGYVIAFEDVTDLVSAQRMAAWGDVARRIAHEIKNPLTPIKLSAERLKRKFAPKVGEESDQLENMTDVIVRQTDELRRIVDEFSQFARMPEPDKRPEDLAAFLGGVMLLQENGQPNVTFTLNLPDEDLWILADSALIGRAITNLLKNAGEAIAERQQTQPLPKAQVILDVIAGEKNITIEISDNGAGLPEDRSRLLEPYVTNRASGTGLGLSIVLKTIEEHGGSFHLSDAMPFAPGDRPGAKAVVRLPRHFEIDKKTNDLGVQYG